MMLNSWSPKPQRVNFALSGAHSRKYMRGLWSENIVTLVAKTKFLNFLKAYITANASLSIEDIADWVAVSLQLAKTMGFSRLPSVHCIRQHPPQYWRHQLIIRRVYQIQKYAIWLHCTNTVSTTQKHVDAQRSKKSYWRHVFSSNQ